MADIIVQPDEPAGDTATELSVAAVAETARSEVIAEQAVEDAEDAAREAERAANEALSAVAEIPAIAASVAEITIEALASRSAEEIVALHIRIDELQDRLDRYESLPQIEAPIIDAEHIDEIDDGLPVVEMPMEERRARFRRI